MPQDYDNIAKSLLTDYATVYSLAWLTLSDSCDTL